MGPGHGDRALQGAELAQQLGARVLAQAALAGRHPLGVVGRDGRAEDDLDVVAGRDVASGVAGADVHPHLAQGLGDRAGGRAVRATDLRAQLRGHPRVAAHPRAADADQVQAPSRPGQGTGARRREAAQPLRGTAVEVAMPSDRPGAWSALPTALLVIAAIVVGVILSLL